MTIRRFLPFTLCATLAAAADAGPKPGEPVSYYKHIRPILQGACHGCHQPAKAKGEYVMTEFAALVKGGADDGTAVVPGKPDESSLIKNIIPGADGKVEMPKKGDALKPAEVALIRQWITEGAKDDTPANAVQRYNPEHPPVYSRPPGINSLAWSPDGKTLAIAGFHEIILYKGDGSGPAGRLIGLSERLTTIRYSPDGKYIAATGGLPSRMGEVQIWQTADAKLKVSVPVTYDTVYGASWSPDSKLVAFGCASDKSLRAVEAENGTQVLFMASHDDWVLDTVFSTKGDHVISAGRDMTAKLTELATQRFVDNLTSITPGALKGGLTCIDRHPKRDELLVGGADGVPQIYRMVRLVQRRIGDNSNLIRKYPAMEGRIWSVHYSADGKRALAASSLDGKGAVNIYNADFDTALPDNIKGIFGKVSTSRSAEENAAVEKYQTDGTTLLHHIDLPTGIYTAQFSPDGSTVAAAGQDGLVRLISTADGKVTKEFLPVALTPGVAVPPQ
ncbi:MAG TPA: c-type cytochrome domain-containing protein [Verrucomicrobiales bacterium]|nr:c-type cytochrome domain-containing protein [Verrucomicrobiales bacterium]